jgi:hypothetical protein
MTQPAVELVELIVREVMSRLGAADGRSGVPPDNLPPAGELAVDSRVVSLAGLQGRLEGVRRLVVAPGAVVTPSVRDELRRRNVAVVRGRAAAPPSGGAAEVLMMVLGSRFDPAPLEAALAAAGLAVRVEWTDCLVAATDAVARQLGKPP